MPEPESATLCPLKGEVAMNKGICTYCGKRRPVTKDHVIPRCLFFEPSDERSIKVPSCGSCNWNSQEGLLKTFIAMFDDRVTESRAREVAHPKSRRDLRAFLRICTGDLKVAYPEKTVTALLKKVILGLRRYLLTERWTFASKDSLGLLTVVRVGDERVLRPLPLKVGGPNPAFTAPPEFMGRLDNPSHRFREWAFDMDSVGIITLKYNRTLNGNELVLVGLVGADGCEVLDVRAEE
jgi:hypothetical protein